MKIKISTNEYTNLLTIFSKNFIKGGIMLGIALTIIDIIKYQKSAMSFYAFISGSFFLINLLQFYYIDKVTPSMSIPFLYHTIIGGIVWVIFSIILYIFYLQKIATHINILLVFLIIIITSIFYYLLIEYKYIK